MIGQTISHYRILEKLGAGGMGVVYKAQDTRLDRAVALKFLPEHSLNDAQALERFRREVQAASALNHPGICTIYDAGEEDGRPFIAMEFIDGETLRQYIQGKPLPQERVLSLGIQLADAISVAHAEGIIHRDLKPANIFVTRRGQTKILDFGLAKLVRKGVANGAAAQEAAEESLSIVGVISGTPSYMSPEQIRGDDLDTRTDVFSLGLLLYEMATGRQAFSGNTGGVIIEAVLTKAPAAVRNINPEITPELEAVINKALEKDIAKRYQSAAEVCSDLETLKRGLESGHTVTSLLTPAPRATPAVARYKWPALGFAALLLALLIGGWFYKTRPAHALGESDTIVVADFNNKTGDTVFDDTLRQGLSAQLQQSPFLNFVSEQRIQQTLALMGQPPDKKLTPEIARDLCRRTGSKAYLSGTISTLGSQYVIGVNAVNCQTGDSLAQQQVTADSKEQVLKALDEATTKLRERLGESLKTIKKLDTPIEEATTPSLEALQAYSLGRTIMMGKGDYQAAVPLLQRATRIDPNFAMAYGLLGTCYANLGEQNLAEENTEKSYELRAHVSEWEKFYIESHYYHFVTGELEKAREVYELWGQTYPRERVSHTNLGVVYQMLGQYDKSLAEFREAMRLAPTDGANFSNLADAQMQLNQFGESRATADEAVAKHLDSPVLHFVLYQLSFLQHDDATMAQQLAWSTGKPGKENIMLYLEAEVAARSGDFAKARSSYALAVASALRAEEKETAARIEAAAALSEASCGLTSDARQRAAATLQLSNGRDAQYVAALALAIAGDSAKAQSLGEDLASRFPRDTMVQLNYLPTLRAQILLDNSNNGIAAVEILQVASSYDLGVPENSTFSTNLYPVYVRGQAFLAARQGEPAAAEFQKILDHPGIVVGESIGTLTYLGLARAYRLSGDRDKAKAAYDEFFRLWKDAEADVPVLKEAQSEYAQLS
jgi:eukaryotic-like serine/threonine-protein kinase